MKTYKLEKYWYLGFLGFIGFYELPLVLNYFQGNGSIWSLTHLLWFLWFFHFAPKNDTKKKV
ncbi:MAG: hypothetical protein V3U92_13125 [Cellulophaga sp.]